jgi:hypothetical protein
MQLKNSRKKRGKNIWPGKSDCLEKNYISFDSRWEDNKKSLIAVEMEATAVIQ